MAAPRAARARVALEPPALSALPSIFALVVAGIALVRMAMFVDSRGTADVALWTVELAAGISAALAGGWLVQRSPGSAPGWLLQLAAICLAISALTDTGATLPDAWLPFAEATSTVQLWANVLGRSVLLAAVVVALPDRAAHGRTGTGPGTALLAALVVAVTAGAVLHARPDVLQDTAFGFGNRVWIDAARAVPAAVFLVLLAVHVASLLLLARRRAADEPTAFQVVGWSLAAAALPAAFPGLADRLPAQAVEVLAVLVVPVLPVMSLVAILRALSWTVRRLVSRTIVWTLLSLTVLLAQALAVAVAALAGGRAGFVAAVAVTALVAACFQAARRRLQVFVDRLVYGAERDPAVAVEELGRRMELTLGPEEVLPDLAACVAAAFGVGVVVELASPSGPREVARAGSFDERGIDHQWPLVHQGQQLGTLTARAPAAAPLRAGDVATLRHLAAQAAVAAHGVRTALELRRSQTALVGAVEEERRRLQRDLHDGLGPALAGVALGLRAARNQLSQPAGDPGALLERLGEEVESSVEEVRRLVHGLRPAVLDQLGLAAALVSYAQRCTTSATHVDVLVDGELPVLPAAVEVAAYRIATEAVTNAVRHAGARSCTVRLSVDGNLRVAVEDDGMGIPADAAVGVGLPSMRDRSASVGGRLLLTRSPQGGTSVVAVLPVEVAGV